MKILKAAALATAMSISAVSAHAQDSSNVLNQFFKAAQQMQKIVKEQQGQGATSAEATIDGEYIGRITTDQRYCGFTDNPFSLKVQGGKFVARGKDIDRERVFEGDVSEDGKLSAWGRWGVERFTENGQISGKILGGKFEGSIYAERSGGAFCSAKINLEKKVVVAEPKVDKAAEEAERQRQIAEAKRLEEERLKQERERLQEAQRKEEERKRRMAEAQKRLEAQRAFERAEAEGKRFEQQLTELDKKVLQLGLSELGHLKGVIDGLVGSGTRGAIKRYQSAISEHETGYVNETQMKSLRDAAEGSSRYAEITSPPAAPKYAASFDCTKAQAPIEVLICSDEELSALDVKQAELYSEKHSTADASIKASVLQDQRAWLKQRVQDCDIPKSGSVDVALALKARPCLVEQFGKRIASYEQTTSVAAAQTTPVAVAQTTSVAAAQTTPVAVAQTTSVADAQTAAQEPTASVPKAPIAKPKEPTIEEQIPYLADVTSDIGLYFLRGSNAYRDETIGEKLSGGYEVQWSELNVCFFHPDFKPTFDQYGREKISPDFSYRNQNKPNAPAWMTKIEEWEYGKATGNRCDLFVLALEREKRFEEKSKQELIKISSVSASDWNEFQKSIIDVKRDALSFEISERKRIEEEARQKEQARQDKIKLNTISAREGKRDGYGVIVLTNDTSDYSSRGLCYIDGEVSQTQKEIIQTAANQEKYLLSHNWVGERDIDELYRSVIRDKCNSVLASSGSLSKLVAGLDRKKIKFSGAEVWFGNDLILQATHERQSKIDAAEAEKAQFQKKIRDISGVKSYLEEDEYRQKCANVDVQTFISACANAYVLISDVIKSADDDVLQIVNGTKKIKYIQLRKGHVWALDSDAYQGVPVKIIGKTDVTSGYEYYLKDAVILNQDEWDLGSIEQKYRERIKKEEAQRKAAEEAARRKEIAEQKRKERERERAAAEFMERMVKSKTYTARIWCEFNGQRFQVINCVQPGDLKVRTSSGLIVYDYQYQGRLMQNVLTIDLGEHFQISAYNSQDNLMLWMRVENGLGEVVYEDAKGKYGMVGVKN